jgi:error-prone DNA polymerase
MAIDVAGFTPAESDQLRQAMGSKRSLERMAALKNRLYDGMATNGITGDIADQIYDKLVAFANFGFPESHSVSFAYLVYSSAWMKLHYPAAFTAGLLDGQPMGFWSPQTIVADARRHGVIVRRPDINASQVASSLEPDPDSAGGAAVRLGLEYVRHVGRTMAERIVAGQPYANMQEVVRRTGVSTAQMEALATAGAFGGKPGGKNAARTQRPALWAAGAIALNGADLEHANPSTTSTSTSTRQGRGRRRNPAPPPAPGELTNRSQFESGLLRPRPGRLPGLATGLDAPPLPEMTPIEVNRADLWATGLSPESHPVEFLRPVLEQQGVLTARALTGVPSGRRVTVGGVVTHRQRPATAQGVIFINLEDETGLVNVVCSRGAWARHRRVARSEPALLIRGTIENVEGVINLVAEHLEPLRLTVPTRSRDFR